MELARRRQLEFTADASHELRTPLSVIEAEVSLSLTGPRSGSDYRATLGRIGRESQRLRDIVEDLLWLARFDSEPPAPGRPAGGRGGDRLGVRQSLLCRGAAPRHRPLVRNEGQGQPWINAPPEWVDRLTAVLVDNACRYAGEGGTVQIAVAGDREPGQPERGRQWPRHRARGTTETLRPLSSGDRPGERGRARPGHRRRRRAGDRRRVAGRSGRSRPGWSAHGGPLAPRARMPEDRVIPGKRPSPRLSIAPRPERPSVDTGRKDRSLSHGVVVFILPS